jgi:hypothetical protein
MLVLEHMKQLVKACQPANREEWERLWADIKPVKFGTAVSWEEAAAYTLAQYQVPDQTSYLIVLRTECYTVNFTSGAADYGLYEPPPPGFAYWQYVPAGSSGGSYIVTDQNAGTHIVLDCDEMLWFKGGSNVSLIGNFNVSPDGDTRTVRTLVYGYVVGTSIANRLGRGEMEIAVP